MLAFWNTFFRPNDSKAGENLDASPSYDWNALFYMDACTLEVAGAQRFSPCMSSVTPWDMNVSLWADFLLGDKYGDKSWKSHFFRD